MNHVFTILKYLGGVLLIVSYIAQDFLYENLNTKYSEYEEVSRSYSDLNNAALGYLNLYFAFDLEDDEIERAIESQYINMAAQKQAMAQVVQIMSRDIDQAEKMKLTQALVAEASAVYDYSSYINFIQRTSEIDVFKAQDAMDRKREVLEKKEFYRWVFLSSNVVGSALLLIGFKGDGIF
jgi:hypothetical protein